jgi:hypothetical protein
MIIVIEIFTISPFRFDSQKKKRKENLCLNKALLTGIDDIVVGTEYDVCRL